MGVRGCGSKNKEGMRPGGPVTHDKDSNDKSGVAELSGGEVGQLGPLSPQRGGLKRSLVADVCNRVGRFFLFRSSPASQGYENAEKVHFWMKCI